MDDPILRRATPQDAAILAQISERSFRETFVEDFAIPYPADDLRAFVSAHHGEAAFIGKLADPLQASWIAEAGGRAVAYANAGPCTLPHAEARPEHAELNRIYVLRSAQGAGIGRRLLETALAWMEQASSGPLWLGVWSGNLKAQRLYARYGFHQVGEYLFPVGAWRDKEFILRRG